MAPAVRRAPFLNARATPRLDRRRRVLVKLSCDQNCTVAVRLTGALRSKRTLRGTIVRRSIVAGRVVSLRLRLPSKPRTALKTVWITGTVRERGRPEAHRQAAGDAPALTTRSSSASTSAGVVAGFISVSLSATAPLTRVRPITACAGREQRAVDADVASSPPAWRNATMIVLGGRDELELGPPRDRLRRVLGEVEDGVDHLAEPPAAGRAKRDQDLQRVEAP